MTLVYAGLHSADSRASNCRSSGLKFESQLVHITFVEIDHELISAGILPHLLISEGLLLVTGPSMCISAG